MMTIPTQEDKKLNQQVQELQALLVSLQQACSILDKLAILNQLPIVQNYLKQQNPLTTFLGGLNPECDYAIKSIIAIGQAPIVFNLYGTDEDKFELLRQLLKQLLSIEHFYEFIGGIIGYHAKVLEMIVFNENPISSNEVHYIHPEGLRLDRNTPDVQKAIKYGIQNLSQTAEIYPVGGAGDRLSLTDPMTGVPLPAAVLAFNGRTLLEELIRDLQAREYLYFKLYGRQITTPIAMMTSSEKNNHNHILDICAQKKWFGRGSGSFFFFIQPLVPVITVEGNWSMSAPLKLTLKPGGHGVIWKLADEQGVFDWLASHGYYKSLVRQINNPLAGTDYAITALIGLGCYGNKALGFISCERLLKSAEGTNVLIEKEVKDGFQYCLTNIEYTDFDKKGIGEIPVHPGSSYSKFPTNTNILFIDIASIRAALKTNPFPGQIINMKTEAPYINVEGKLSYIKGGRLESTMQNIADSFTDTFNEKLHKNACRSDLKTFIVYNQRIKTISTTKKSYHPNESPIGTPEQAFYDILSNNRDLLLNYCGFEVPLLNTLEDYVQNGPNFLMTYHPALGPFYSIIGQKLHKGKFGYRAELKLEIAEVQISYLKLEGSLLIESTVPLGSFDTEDRLVYGKESRCYLHHVNVINEGIDFTASNCFWKDEISRHESLRIVLHEGAEFQAEHMTFKGSFEFEVPPYHRLIITQDTNGIIHQHLSKIEHPSWSWDYSFDTEDQIQLISSKLN